MSKSNQQQPTVDKGLNSKLLVQGVQAAIQGTLARPPQPYPAGMPTGHSFPQQHQAYGGYPMQPPYAQHQFYPPTPPHPIHSGSAPLQQAYPPTALGPYMTYGAPAPHPYPTTSPFLQQQQQQVHQPMTLQAAPGSTVAVIGSNYCTPQVVDLCFAEQFSATGDDFRVTDMHGQVWFELDAKYFSISKRRTLVDPHGQTVVTLKKKAMSMHGTWNMYRGKSTDSQHRVCSVEPKIMTMSPYLNVYLNDGDKHPDFVVKGNFLAKQFTISKVEPGGAKRVLAECRKQSWHQSVNAYLGSLANLDTYFARIQPGVDAAFVSALCLLLDEIYHDNEG